jgi:hypothetical protein
VFLVLAVLAPFQDWLLPGLHNGGLHNAIPTMGPS